MSEERYWIDFPVGENTLESVSGRSLVGGWTPVVDEERGGVIAYFGREDDAEKFLSFLNQRCTTCGGRRDENPYCSNSFHVGHIELEADNA